VKKPRINHPPPPNVLRLHIPALPQFPERLRRLLEAAYGGAESMKLSDWRDLELELKRRSEI
jgi:hypothetical protein